MSDKAFKDGCLLLTIFESDAAIAFKDGYLLLTVLKHVICKTVTKK